MKNNSFTRITALTMALAIICGSAASCGTKKDSGAVKATELIQNSYKAEPIECSEQFINITDMIYTPENDRLFVYGTLKGEKTAKLFITDLNLSEFRQADLGYDDSAETYFSFEAGADGSLYAVQVNNDYGDFELPDYEDPDFDYSTFDYEAMEEARVSSYKFLHIDNEGKIISENDMKGIEDYVSPDLYFNSISAFGSDQFLVSFAGSSEKDIVVDTEGRFIDTADLGSFSWLINMVGTDDGKTLACGYTAKGMKCRFMDTKEFKPDGQEIEISDNLDVMNIYKGKGDHIVYLDARDGLYGIKSDGSSEEIINWTDSDVSSDYSRSVIPLDNGEFLVYNGSEEGFLRLSQRDSSEFENTNVITLGLLYDNGVVSEYVKKFNKSHDDVRIKTINYSQYNEYDEESFQLTDSGENHLRMDIVSGKCPDMIVSYNNNLEVSMAGKDVFADLREMLASDSTLSEDDFMPNVIKASDINGKILSLSPTFSISTMAVKKKYCDKENWSFEDLKKAYEKMPEDAELTEMTTRTSAFYLLRNTLGDCIDYSKGTCNFDSDIFRDVLEFCSQFKDDSEVMDWYKNASDEELNDFFMDSQMRYKNEKSFIYDMYLGDFRDYKMAKQGTFDDDITLVGVPTEDGSGAKIQFDASYAILEDSKSKRECWEFIKSFFNDEYYESDMSYGFPSLKNAFEKRAENASKPRTYTDDEGNEHEIDDYIYINNNQVKIDPLTEDEKKFIIDYVKNTDSCDVIFTDEVDQIINECISAYFKNEKSADETIELINSKVSILLSEQS